MRKSQQLPNICGRRPIRIWYDVRAELRYGSAKPAETAGDAAVAQLQPMDVVSSYCAFRSVEIKPDTKGVARFHLNGKPLFVKGVLDQGYWPDGS